MRGRHALTLVALLLVPSAAFPAQTFTATLSAAAVVPPTFSTGTATAHVVIDDAWTLLTYSVTYSGLIANVNNASLQHGPPGVNGDFVFQLARSTGSQSGTFSGAINLSSTPVVIADFLAGLYYVEIRTFVYTNGELRGQLSGAVTPARRGTWGRIKSMYR